MRSTLSTMLLALAVAAGLVGCQSSGGRVLSDSFPVLDAASANAHGLSTNEVNAAVRLGNAKCIRCHRFYDPTPYTDPQWQTWMRKMSRKARLNPDQEALLFRYLGAIRTNPSMLRRDRDSEPR